MSRDNVIRACWRVWSNHCTRYRLPWKFDHWCRSVGSRLRTLDRARPEASCHDTNCNINWTDVRWVIASWHMTLISPPAGSVPALSEQDAVEVDFRWVLTKHRHNQAWNFAWIKGPGLRNGFYLKIHFYWSFPSSGPAVLRLFQVLQRLSESHGRVLQNAVSIP